MYSIRNERKKYHQLFVIANWIHIEFLLNHWKDVLQCLLRQTGSRETTFSVGLIAYRF